MITPLPSPPLRSDGPATFADKGDTFMAALPTFVTQANALGAQVELDAAAVAAAAPGAVAAANFQGEYSAGVTYAVGQSVSYGGDTWFAKTINTGVTPVVGAAWQKVPVIPSQTGNAGKVLSTDGSNLGWVAANAGSHGVYLKTGNGRGSTNTTIRRFTTTIYNTGSAITYADSATLGASFTINDAGIYSISYADGADTLIVTYHGVSKNSSQLTTDVSEITAANRIGMTASQGSGNPVTLTVVDLLSPGDVIRPHGSTNNNSTSNTYFSIRKICL